jgi:hypothetical protein
LTGENRRTRRKACPRVTFSTTNPTWIDPGSNPSLRSEWSANNDQSHGTGQAATIANIQSGFEKTGILPTKAEVFEDFICSPAETTNNHIPNPKEDHLSNPRPVGMTHVFLLHILKLNKVKRISQAQNK